MQRQRTRAVIVDGYSTGRELLGALKDRGVECLHLRSSAELPPEVARCFDATGYDADLGYAGPPAEAAEALGRLRPDVLVKGADYTIDKVVGAVAVQAAGGRVLLVDLVPGHSTTATIARLAG